MLKKSPAINVPRRYDDIYKKHYIDKAGLKYISLHESMKEYCESIETLDHGFTAHVSPALLNHLVHCYFIDLIAHKDRHFASQEKLADAPKVAAYSIKWILKTSPIFVASDPELVLTEEQINEMLMVNINFCLIYAAELLRLDTDDFNEQDKDDLVFHMLFKEYDEMLYYMIFNKYFTPLSNDLP